MILHTLDEGARLLISGRVSERLLARRQPRPALLKVEAQGPVGLSMPRN